MDEVGFLDVLMVEEAVVLVVLGVVEQRHAAVLEVLVDGATVTSVAARYGVSRQTVHRWLRRYARDGLPGLVDRPPTPRSCPHQIPPEVEAAVVGLRREHPGWGPRTIGHQLARQGVVPVPSRSSIYRALVRHGLIDPQARKRKRSDYRRWERSRSMELWQMDITGGVELSDGTKLQVLTGIDDHSRFCVSAKVLVRSTARPVCAGFAEAMRAHGVPEQVLTDNGKVFTGRFGRGVGEVLFDRICRENGIRHLLTAPRSPTTTGKVERFHKTLKHEFLAGRVFDTIVEAQEAIDAWVVHYNTDRPHQGIGMVAPIERFRLAIPDPICPTEPIVAALPEPGPDVLVVTRRVSTNGTVSLETIKYVVGRWLAGETVLITLRDGLVEISHRGKVVATHARRWRPGKPGPVQRRPSRQPGRGATVGVPVVRKIDGSGSLSFAGHAYRVGNPYKRMSAIVTIVGDTVQIAVDGQLVRTHPIRHDRTKEHGAYANPAGKPDRINAAPTRSPLELAV